MGNASQKLAAKCAILNRDEQKSVGSAFQTLSRSSDRIREEDIAKLWGPQVDPRLTGYISNFLFGCGDDKAPSADFQRFAELYVYNVRGTTDERLTLTYASLGEQYSDTAVVPYQLFREYCESVASTYMKMMKLGGGRRIRDWTDKGFKVRALHVQTLGETLAASVAGCDEAPPVLSAHALSTGLNNDTLLRRCCELVFRQLYGTARRSDSTAHDAPALTSLMPYPSGVENMPDYPALLDLSHIVWLNSQLPAAQRHKWRFLFSSNVHGESFSTMVGRIVDEGPSLLVVEDETGYMFGGFASRAWTLGPNFHGTDESFLFTLAPRMRCFPATGYNDHYQYLNSHQKAMPNGLLMGGQFGFGAIWLESEFGTGSSAESCSTYRGYVQLSKNPNFKVRSLEVWGMGDRPLTLAEQEEGVRDTSVLDGNSDAKALLRMAGREQHSDGLRDAPPL